LGKNGLDYWVNRLSFESMPVFAHAAQRVAGTANNENSTFAELAWTILQDPALTAQVLKVSNSIYYNPISKPITTVSRAVMRLGFDAVRTMCLTASLIEAVLSKLGRKRVALEVARAFHAAVQAKMMASRCKFVQPEEVFVAALLSRIGHIAFWCFAGETGNRLEEALDTSGMSESRTELQVLGFRLEELTLRLAHEWKLSGLLETVLHGSDSNDPRTQAIKLGSTLSQCAEKAWDSSQTKKVVQTIGDFLKIPEKEAYRLVHGAAKDAADIAESYGAKASSRLIPIPPEFGQAGREKPEEPQREYPKTDHAVQLASLRDLSAIVLSRNGNVNSVMSVMLEGIHRGIGMDRVFLALLTPDRHAVKAKYGLGWLPEEEIENFHLNMSPSTPVNIVKHVMETQQPLWVTEEPAQEILALLTREMSQFIGNGPFFIMPVCMKGRAIGIVYADRTPSGRELDNESYESFTFFGQQANMGLAALV